MTNFRFPAFKTLLAGFLLEGVMDLINWLLMIAAAIVLMLIVGIVWRWYLMTKRFEAEQLRLQAYFDDQVRRGARATEHRIKL